ncbi:MAG: tyrosine-type recombinase/integrase [Actinomycetales bacterium]
MHEPRGDLSRPGAQAFSAAALSAAAFLSRYGPRTREAYALDLRLWFDYCQRQGIEPLTAHRQHIELFAVHLEQERNNAAKSVHRRLTTLRAFYRMLVIDGHLAASPAEYVRLPRLYYDEMRTLGLDKDEVVALVVQARDEGTSSEAALIWLMALMGLRVSEACNVRVEDIGDIERGHRVLRLVGKGGKPATAPIPPSVAAVLDAARGQRRSGVLCLRRNGRPFDRRSADRVVKRVARAAGIDKHVHPHVLRHAYVTCMLDAGVPLRDVQIAARHANPSTTTRYDRARQNLDRHGNHALAAAVSEAMEAEQGDVEAN